MNPIHPHILELGNPVLRSRCRPVERFDSNLRLLAKRMEKIMTEAQGVGLAAPQIGSLHRIIIVPGEQAGEFTQLVNPTWESLGENKEPALEGCLSLPGINLPVERERAIGVKAQTIDGESLEFESRGLQARAVQHETDHLDGVLIIDRVPAEMRWMALWQHMNPSP